jgi:hypothetical protein
MFRSIFIAIMVALILVCFAAIRPAQAQGVISKTLTAASQADLPCSTEIYMAVGHKFKWTFDWDNTFTNPACADVFPAVVSSDLALDINNGQYGNGHKHLEGTNNTGYPSDYLQITQAGGSCQGVINNMVFKVTYLTDTPQMPGRP